MYYFEAGELDVFMRNLMRTLRKKGVNSTSLETSEQADKQQSKHKAKIAQYDLY